MTAFYNAAQDVATDPTSGSARDAFLASAEGVASQFRNLAGSFDATRIGIKQDVDQTVARVDELCRSLSTLNSSIKRSADGTSQSAALEDHSDRQLEALSTLVPVDDTHMTHGPRDPSLDNAHRPYDRD